MKFSIVIPAFNCEEYLSECIKSVLQQTHEDFEIVVVDDGSSDSTLGICREFESSDNRIMVLHKDNGGPFSARLAAYSFLTGDYVLHIDADDSLNRDALKRLAAVFGSSSI